MELVDPHEERGGDRSDEPLAPGNPHTVGPGAWFMARYVGECSSCNAGFLPGDEIRADGSGGYEGRCCR
ncbi:MAG TPA: hypothetical protein VF482_02135 [Trebonia sp.]